MLNHDLGATPPNIYIGLCCVFVLSSLFIYYCYYFSAQNCYCSFSFDDVSNLKKSIVGDYCNFVIYYVIGPISLGLVRFADIEFGKQNSIISYVWYAKDGN